MKLTAEDVKKQCIAARENGLPLSGVMAWAFGHDRSWGSVEVRKIWLDCASVLRIPTPQVAALPGVTPLGLPMPKKAKRPTFEAARAEIFEGLTKAGWSIRPMLKQPQAVSPRGVTLYFKAQAVYLEGHSLWCDIRTGFEAFKITLAQHGVVV